MEMKNNLKKRLRNEIIDVMEKKKGKMKYEDIREMEYMKMVV